MSSDSDAPRDEGGDKTERMDRLRALLNKPIKIPESASTGTEDADYAAAVAAAATPQGASTTMTPEAKTPKGAKAPVETPPAVKAAAEALDRLTEQEKDAVVEGSGSGRSKSRRTWADAYLAKPDKPLTPEEVRADLMVSLKEQGAELRELIAKRGIAQEKAQATALDEVRAEVRERADEQAAAQTAATAQAVTSAQEEASRLRGHVDELTATTSTLRTDLDAARAAAASATSAAKEAAAAASAAQEVADAATKKAATATTFAFVGIALAVVAAVLGFVV